MDIVRNFTAGVMNKSVDERLVPDGEYIDALNIRLNSTEASGVGTVENALGNLQVTTLSYNGVPLNSTATCIGAFEDGINETIYWFVHSPADGVDMIVSYNEMTTNLVYHVVSTSVLNFSRSNLITQVNKIEDLLFFTDGSNPPRRINVTRGYPTEPELTEKDISVIVAPPFEAPSVELLNMPGDDNFIVDRIISFAYRYQYRDGEYSALSQFSDYAFRPGFFRLDTQSYQNSGMQNSFNAVKVNFNTGGPDVIGIDLCFKIANSPVINVIQKYNKIKSFFSDNQITSTVFKTKKIYTVLPESELLRLYDNVPLVAKAQTIMGNRLMYGNYKDGNELKDIDGNNISTSFSVELVSDDIGTDGLSVERSPSLYSIDPANQNLSIPNSSFTIDLDGKELVEGAAIGFNIFFRRDRFSDVDPANQPETNPEDIFVSATLVLKQDYLSPYDLSVSDEFIEFIGDQSSANVIANCGTVDQGLSITDKFSCSVTAPALPVQWVKDSLGIDDVDQGMRIISEPGSNQITIQNIAVRYSLLSNPTVYLYEYFSFSNVSPFYQRLSNSGSLHSNRDYSVGIIYMDDFGRSTTVLVSDENSVYVPASKSTEKNYLKISIPPTQRPPYWATKYKFAVMPSGLDYETIYSNQYFIDPSDNTAYIKLEGDNQNKTKVGDNLIVKIDSSGAVDSVIKTRVLEIGNQLRDFIPGNKDDNGDDIEELPGLYMKLKPQNWSLSYGKDNVFNSKTSTVGTFTRARVNVSELDIDTGSFVHWEIPEGSLVRFNISIKGRGRAGDGTRGYEYIKEHIANRDYENLFDFVTGEDIRIDRGNIIGGETLSVPGFDNQMINIPFFATYYNCLFTGSGPCVNEITEREVGNYKFQFHLDPVTNRLSLEIRAGLPRVSGFLGIGSRDVSVDAEITVVKSSNLVVFETEPTESNPDVYFIGSENFRIENGVHLGNVQDQTANVPAIIDLNMYNCFSFGNGVESYKINDELAGRFFRLGNTISSVAEQDFMLADRFSSITYSGVFNPENNVNKLNEFNLGLANFKDLERIFGPIYVLHPRQTDILVIQEDKISYVLAEKNLLSDAAGGGAVTSVPEVLGTQIARPEEYGISNNAESFVSWGFDKYFTDAKRAAVIKLSGTGMNEQLEVISSYRMRSWFRDEFIGTIDNHKMGGYDPYMDEYVLSLTEIKKDRQIQNIDCGLLINKSVGTEGTSSFDVVLGSGAGTSDFNYNLSQITAGQTVQFVIIYGSTTITTGPISTPSSGTLSLNKNIPSLTTARLNVIQSGGISTWSASLACPVSRSLEVFKITVNSEQYENQLIHNEFGWENSESDLRLNSEQTILLGGTQTFRIADFKGISGREGSGVIPIEGSTVSIRSNRKTGDNFIFEEPVHNLKYLLTNTRYQPGDIDTILSLSQTGTAIQNPSEGLYISDFTYTNPNDYQYLYIVYDYRKSVSLELCYSNSSAFDACCNCEPEPIV